ncbi:hypothetical protein I5168_12535 [Nonlabens sp. SCSIO 43208]|uniref:hypothetical protein n=1 Tax=Nonlabens sp. SCSIO 43208 TaxID=2793009 RepID=UPI003D6B2826
MEKMILHSLKNILRWMLLVYPALLFSQEQNFKFYDLNSKTQLKEFYLDVVSEVNHRIFYPDNNGIVTIDKKIIQTSSSIYLHHNFNQILIEKSLFNKETINIKSPEQILDEIVLGEEVPVIVNIGAFKGSKPPMTITSQPFYVGIKVPDSLSYLLRDVNIPIRKKGIWVPGSKGAVCKVDFFVLNESTGYIRKVNNENYQINITSNRSHVINIKIIERILVNSGETFVICLSPIKGSFNLKEAPSKKNKNVKNFFASKRNDSIFLKDATVDSCPKININLEVLD